LLALRKSLSAASGAEEFSYAPSRRRSERFGSSTRKSMNSRCSRALERAISMSLLRWPPTRNDSHGYHAELDELRNLSQHSKQIIAAMEERERKRHHITR